MEGLYRFKLDTLQNIDESEVCDFLKLKFKLSEERCKQFLDGRYVFKPSKEETVDKFIKLLGLHGIQCSKHPHITKDQEILEYQAKVEILREELNAAREYIVELEEKLNITDKKNFDEVMSQDLSDVPPSEKEKAKLSGEHTFTDTEEPDKKIEVSVPAEGNRKKKMIVAAATVVVVSAVVAFFMLPSSPPEVVMNYDRFAARNEISVEKAREIAQSAGSFEAVTQMEIDAQRLGLSLLEYYRIKPYADACRGDYKECKNATDYVNIFLKPNMMMNRFKENCESVTQRRLNNQARFDDNSFSQFDAQSTQFRTDGKFTLLSPITILDDYDNPQRSSIYCTIDTETGKIRDVEVM